MIADVVAPTFFLVISSGDRTFRPTCKWISVLFIHSCGNYAPGRLCSDGVSEKYVVKLFVVILTGSRGNLFYVV